MTTFMRLGGALAAAGLVLGAITAAAATAEAAAAKPRACNTDAVAAPLHTTAAVNLRTGKGVGYASQAVLSKGTDIYAHCWGVTRDHSWWAYGEALSGRSRGHMGWVANEYVAAGYKHPE
ncbi:hypothetical protein [Streptomyces sp. NPDC046976]|uniref:hypothetical protein n=1 Tax=Streptomyces sp. NPDC046976 TaxID=3155258 RepID=UPI0034069E13